MEKNRLLVEKLIQNNLGNFSKNEKRIASFFLDHKHDLAFLSIQEISKRVSVGRATIVRFAKKLGYEGFYALKQDIQNDVQTNIAPLEKFRLAINKYSDDYLSISRIAENEVSNINWLLNNIDTKAFKKAIEILSGAGVIYTTGFNLSSFLAGITSYLLQRVGLKSFPTNLGGRSLDEQLINISKSDVLIAFSLPPYSPETIKAAQFARKQKCKIVSFTNSLTAPIVQFSDVVLNVKTDSEIFTNSFSATLVMIYSLVNEIALHDKVRFKETVKKKFAQSST